MESVKVAILKLKFYKAINYDWHYFEEMMNDLKEAALCRRKWWSFHVIDISVLLMSDIK